MVEYPNVKVLKRNRMLFHVLCNQHFNAYDEGDVADETGAFEATEALPGHVCHPCASQGFPN